MVNVVEIAPGSSPPDKPDGVYVWAGTGNVMWGSLRAFQASPKSLTRFAEAAWADATAGAVRDAARAQGEIVYVVRNA